MSKESLTEAAGECPYCGESIDLLIDESLAGQIYIEDCFVCCRPIQVQLQIDIDGDLSPRLYHENEVPVQ